jgi:hypothetical protein
MAVGPTGKPLSERPLASEINDDDGFAIIQDRTGTSAAPKLRLTTFLAIRLKIGEYLETLNDAYLTGANTFAEQRAAAAVVAANAYTDQKGDPVAILAEGKAYSVAQDTLRLAESKAYTDGRDALLTEYVDANDLATLNSAKSYTDALAGGVSGLAPLVSPAFTGVPTAPTAALGTNTTQVATTAHVKAATDAVIAGAPTALNTLDELAAAINDDPAYSTTVNTALALKAPLASPALTGAPTATTPTVDDNSLRISTTAYVMGQLSAVNPLMNGTVAIGTSTRLARADHVHPVDTSRAPIVSPTFTGVPAAPTASSGTNTTQLATTAFVANAISGIGGGGGAAALDGLTDVTINTPVLAQTLRYNGTLFVNSALGVADVTGAAPLAGPTFTGVASGATATADTNTTQLATTAFVVGQAGSASPAMDGTATVGTSARFARQDHVHPVDTSRAPINNAAFTGVPTAPNAAASTNTQQIATTSYVKSQGYATVDSPIFTGVITVPSTALTISSGSIAWNAALGGNVRTLTMNANATLANPTNMAAGRHYTVLVTQDGTGNRTLSFGTAYIFPGSIKPVLSTGAGSKDMLTFYCDGTNMWGVDNKAFG